MDWISSDNATAEVDYRWVPLYSSWGRRRAWRMHSQHATRDETADEQQRVTYSTTKKQPSWQDSRRFAVAVTRIALEFVPGCFKEGGSVMSWRTVVSVCVALAERVQSYRPYSRPRSSTNPGGEVCFYRTGVASPNAKHRDTLGEYHDGLTAPCPAHRPKIVLVYFVVLRCVGMITPNVDCCSSPASAGDSCCLHRLLNTSSFRHSAWHERPHRAPLWPSTAHGILRSTYTTTAIHSCRVREERGVH